MKYLTGCLIFFLVLLAVLVTVLLLYFFVPGRTNFLILGVDGGLDRAELGRTDTIILATINPLKPYVGLLSIPRDLWVPIDGVGENRINTAYFFAEAELAGSGSAAARKVVSQNFDVPVNYHLLLRMDGMLSFIDSMGGVEINLPTSMAGFSEGKHQINGEQALQFARSRSGSDDFSRMLQGQILVQAVLKRMLEPEVWPKLPAIIRSSQAIINTNIPPWLLPRLGLALFRSLPDNIDARTISREMVRPYTTDQGAQVLEPNWDMIKGLVREMFAD